MRIVTTHVAARTHPRCATPRTAVVSLVVMTVTWGSQGMNGTPEPGVDMAASLVRAETLQWRHNEREGVSNHQRHDVYSTVCPGADRRKHQSSEPLAFVRGIHRWPVNSPHKRPVTRKMFPFDDVIMIIWNLSIQNWTSGENLYL